MALTETLNQMTILEAAFAGIFTGLALVIVLWTAVLMMRGIYEIWSRWDD